MYVFGKYLKYVKYKIDQRRVFGFNIFNFSKFLINPSSSSANKYKTWKKICNDRLSNYSKFLILKYLKSIYF